MNKTILNLVRVVVGAQSGRSCRRCSETIPVRDPFGVSEGICGPCRAGAAP